MKAFPDFDNGAAFDAALAALAPLGFVDSTWGNDLCPSLAIFGDDGDSVLRVWIDYADPAARDWGDMVKPFALTIGEDVDGGAFDDVESLIAAARAAALTLAHVWGAAE